MRLEAKNRGCGFRAGGAGLCPRQAADTRLLGAAAGTATPGLKGYAFDVDAAVRVHGADRARLERLCRYILRPPIANDRLVKRSDGRFELRLKRAWSDGTTHLVLRWPGIHRPACRAGAATARPSSLLSRRLCATGEARSSGRFRQP